MGPDPDAATLMDAVNRRLAEVGDAWNETPQPDFGGLSPVQVRRLMQRSDWVAGEGAIRLRIDLARFLATKLATRLLDDARAGELYARLFETCFVRFHVAYGRALEWPELQQQIGYTLYQLGRAARDWRRGDELVEPVVLPLACGRAPRLAAIDTASLLLERAVLDRLVGFGLLERGPAPPASARAS